MVKSKKEDKKKAKEDTESEKDDEDAAKKDHYFWPPHLHQEFMRQFSIYGKTWKVVSQKMGEKGFDDKDQLKCRTHG